MVPKNIDLFAFLLCSSLFNILLSLWYTVRQFFPLLHYLFSSNQTTLVTDREIILIIALFSVVSVSFVSRAWHLNALPTNADSMVHKNELADAQSSHRRRVAALTSAHATELNDLRMTLQAANAKFDRMHGDYEWLSSMYQDQMRGSQEQDDRMQYLERKLAEMGGATPGLAMPLSAPSTMTSFEVLPKTKMGVKTASSLGKMTELEK
ncbi:hypothetical protein NX059_004396 [Plenodomus lindquistii]|nr:hypothetical protein NX059_004396 [Plenodomus lindquistii]